MMALFAKRLLKYTTLTLVLITTGFAGAGCPINTISSNGSLVIREDDATRIAATVSGSLQNPAWSPDGKAILFTRFRGGYNKEPADLLIVNLNTGKIRTLVSDETGNVNLPGASWNASTRRIIFSSSRQPHDEIYAINEAGISGDEVRITNRPQQMAFEPSFSPDGLSIVFESHPVDVEGQGVITRFRIDASEGYRSLTAATDDSRQPNWSPSGTKIVYQKLSAGQWDLWLTDPDGMVHQKLTSGPGSKTDASFSPDGRWIVYSSSENGTDPANLFIISVDGGTSTHFTHYHGYDGAPSWSPDGRKTAFESHPGDPDKSPGTTLWIIDAPIQ